MRYESKAARYKLKSPTREVSFAPGPKRNEAGDQFGIFDSNGDAGIDLFLQGSAAYRKRKPGVKGIWLEGERIEAETMISTQVSRNAVVGNMTEAQLRAVIAASGVGVPQDADKATLAQLAVRCLAGELEPGTVVETASEPEAGLAAQEHPEEPIGEAVTASKASARPVTPRGPARRSAGSTRT